MIHERCFYLQNKKFVLRMCTETTGGADVDYYLYINNERTTFSDITSQWDDRSTWVPYELPNNASVRFDFSLSDGANSSIRDYDVVGGTISVEMEQGTASWDGHSEYFGVWLYTTDDSG